MTAKEKSTIETRLIKALGHPLRQRILEELNKREASPSRLAEALDEPLGNVSYHVKILLEYEAVELVGTKPVRGALEHTYRAIARPYLDDEHWAKIPVSIRRSLFDKTLQQIWEHVVEGAERGGLDDPQTHISWTALDLDQEGYEQVAELFSNALEEVLEIEARAANRLAKLDEADRETRRTELAIMLYDRPRDGESKRSKSRARAAIS